VGERFGWDRGLEFEVVKAKLESRLERAKRDREYGYLAVLYVQLLNGARLSEAIEALQKFAATGERKVRVKVRKRKNAERLIIIPRSIDLRRAAWLAEADPRVLKSTIASYAVRKLKFNTHSLRYALITHLARKGIAPQLIARITGHARLDYVLHYTQQTTAEKLLGELVEGE